MCVTEESIRHSGSQVYGCILNIHGNNWQRVVEFIARLSQVHGSIVNIDVAATSNPQWLNFAIFYDRVDSSLQFLEYMENFSELHNMNVCDLVHRETPAINL
ncbi:unnamed protein product [Rotaria socialis]|uniref:Uncharacterized protein n=1 Tax=Rotaria socialis TaxID=392032 RepID=A0A817R288_9BILA|nr:unnamed protein product [Rotaria socialis]CAF3421582.1 unnamed protein product [Rotaria socialis]CAF3557780.1 unnamed protein product [Rotaria socialis]CAF3557820.1 unnamed protein product [Rotaria socialis]CAF4961693.1 unnamed protein product [Rotaria socialis]